MAFDRWKSWYGAIRPYARFKGHHTEINKLYWSFVPTAGYVKYLERHAPAGTETATLFHASGPNVHRLQLTARDWLASFKEFENWTRLSALLSALSDLETYISTAVTLALRSDPLLRFGQSRAIDGAAWVKKSVTDDVSEYVTDCVKGQWSKRIASYRRLFGLVPGALTASEGDLERMRNIRNGVAHGFGRDLRIFDDPLNMKDGPQERLSEAELLGWLGAIEQVAVAIEAHLLQSHIGNFELLWHFHRWRALPREKLDRRYTEAVAFSRFLNRSFGSTPGREYCKEVERYYLHL